MIRGADHLLRALRLGIHVKSHGQAPSPHVNTLLEIYFITDRASGRYIHIRDLSDEDLDMFYTQPKHGKFTSYIDYIGTHPVLSKKIRVNVRFDPTKPQIRFPPELAYHTKYSKI